MAGSRYSGSSNTISSPHTAPQVPRVVLSGTGRRYDATPPDSRTCVVTSAHGSAVYSVPVPLTEPETV